MNEIVSTEASAPKAQLPHIHAAAIAGGMRKWAIVVKDVHDEHGREAEFGPFDTPERAEMEADKFAKVSLVTEIRVVWTCSSVAHFLRAAAESAPARKIAVEAAAAAAEESARTREIAEALTPSLVGDDPDTEPEVLVIDQGAETAAEIEALHEEALVANAEKDAEVFAKTLGEVVAENEPEVEEAPAAEEPEAKPAAKKVAARRTRAPRKTATASK